MAQDGVRLDGQGLDVLTGDAGAQAVASGRRSEEAVRGRHIPTWPGHQERVDAVHGAGGASAGRPPPGLGCARRQVNEAGVRRRRELRQALWGRRRGPSQEAASSPESTMESGVLAPKCTAASCGPGTRQESTLATPSAVPRYLLSSVCPVS